MEFKLADFEAAVQYFGHYIIGTSPRDTVSVF